MSDGLLNRRVMLANALATAGFVAGLPRLAQAASGSPQCPSVSSPPTALPPLSGTPLGTIAASKNLLLGAQLSIANNPVYGPGMYDSVYQQVVLREKPAFIAFGSAFKFDTVCPDPPDPNGNLVYTQKAYGVTNTWYQVNDLASGAMGHRFLARADALIWNGLDTAPSWLMPLPANSTTATAAYKYNVSFLVKYVQAAVNKMTTLQNGNAGFFHAACIINEPIVPNFGNPQSPTPAYFRDGPWLPPGQQVGTAPKVPDYITQAFKTAQSARASAARALKQPATTAKFFINEALCETDQFGPVMRPALLALLKAMITDKLNIQAVGLECHLQPQMMFDAYHPDWTAFGKFIDDIAALGLEVYITELDVIDYETACSSSAPSSGDSDYLIDIYYSTFLTQVLSHTAVKAVTFWDLSDRYSFYRYADVATLYGYNAIPRPRPANTPWPNCTTLPPNAQAIACPRPGVFDDQMAQKPARQSITSALNAASPRRRSRHRAIRPFPP